jgi:hypothetical protein
VVAQRLGARQGPTTSLRSLDDSGVAFSHPLRQPTRKST